MVPWEVETPQGFPSAQSIEVGLVVAEVKPHITGKRKLCTDSGRDDSAFEVRIVHFGYRPA